LKAILKYFFKLSADL